MPSNPYIVWAKAAGVLALVLAVGYSYRATYTHGREVERGAAALAYVEELAAQQKAHDKELARVKKDAAGRLAAAKRSADARRKGQEHVQANPRPDVCRPDPVHRQLLDNAVDAANAP